MKLLTENEVPMIPYIGGKNYLAPWIISQFPAGYEKMTYAEPFGGAGWVMLKKKPSFCEVYNDFSKNLVNLFRVIRDHRAEFLKRAKWTLHSREMFYEAKEKVKKQEFKDSIDQAIHFAVLRVSSFSGGGTTYGYAKTRNKSSWNVFLRRIIDLRNRYQGLQIENLDFEKVIEKYDSPNTLFYIDPPYVDAEHYYEGGFGLEDHKRLAAKLKTIKGKFLLSYYPHPLLDGLYAEYPRTSREIAKHSYGMTVNSKRTEKPRATELLIRNF